MSTIHIHCCLACPKTMTSSLCRILLCLIVSQSWSFTPVKLQRTSWIPVATPPCCYHQNRPYRPFSTLFGKKASRKGGGKPSNQGQQPQEKKSVQEARFDAQTRQFMFTMAGLTKTLPDKSKTILKDIYLSFYPGAKIGVIGLNGSGKSTLMKIMAGVDTEFDGTYSDCCIDDLLAVANAIISWTATTL